MLAPHYRDGMDMISSEMRKILRYVTPERPSATPLWRRHAGANYYDYYYYYYSCHYYYYYYDYYYYYYYYY